MKRRTSSRIRQPFTWNDAALAVAGGVMLGFAFPPSPFYTLAYVAFIPVLLLMERAQTALHLARTSYLFLFVLHVLTLSWTGGFIHLRDPWMMAAGGALLVIHPLFYFPSIMGARWVWNRLGRAWGVAAFGVFWVAFEYVHSLGELSFPWITLGNSQAYDIARAQIAEFTSTYGLSALVLAFNGLTYVVMMNLSTRVWAWRGRQLRWAAVGLAAIFAVPWAYGTWRMRTVDEERGTPLRIGSLQPNVDPWEKWGTDRINRWRSYDHQFDWHLNATRALAPARPEIVFWAETAIPFHILEPGLAGYQYRLQSMIDSLGIPVFTGLPTSRYFAAEDAPVTARPLPNGERFYESYNSAIVFEPANPPGPIYRKMVLVPFAERIPYASTLRFLIEPLRWNVGISSWGIGQDTIVHSFRRSDGTPTRFGGMICYESVFPNFVREFTKRGAEFLVVITNDSWWGNTPGAYQHAAYASLRAIENRRWVVQSANGGISLIVRPSGNVDLRTDLYTERTLIGTIELRTDESPYLRWGDVFGKASLVGTIGLILFAFIGTRFKGKRHV